MHLVFDEQNGQKLSKQEKHQTSSHKRKYSKDPNIMKQRQALPIYEAKDEILRYVRENQVIVLVGETGSGKTTQIPQFLMEAGYCKQGMIAITQPRRVAAMSIAKRVSEEVGTRLGDGVGYSIRFEDVTSRATRIKYMTDGMLLREFMTDQDMSQYSVVILDEAHERTLRTDILFGLVKSVMKRRRDLKVIIMSATLDADRFSFAQVLYVLGRQYPVRLLHAAEPQEDHLDAAIVATLQIHRENPIPGDILVFLTGQEEIESAEKILKDVVKFLPPDTPGLMIAPIFASLPTSQQSKVFEKTPAGCRKVVLATNIAETSITLPGIRHVIDTGLVKVRTYNPKIGLETLAVQPISKASAEQRTGRAGREAPGVCYRLFTEQGFESLQDTTAPEILRCSLSNVILMMKASGIDDVLGFDYMDTPDKSAIVGALEQLYALGALGDDGNLTEKGKLMSQFPIDPTFSKALISSREYKCTLEMINIVSALSVDSIFFSSYDKREKVSEAMKKFVHYDGDHVTWLNVIKAYESVKGDKMWCSENHIKARAMKQILDVRKQLLQICTKLGFDTTCTSSTENNQSEMILKCLLSGFFQNVAVIQPDGGSYKTLLNNQVVHIHPSSVLFGRKAQAVVYNELVHTSRKYMRNVSVIQLDWLMEVAGHYYGRKAN